MTSALIKKLEGVRDFKKILETAVKELSETYTADVSQIVLSNPLDRNITSICEYLSDESSTPTNLPKITLPLAMQGGGLGMVSMARRNQITEPEVNSLRITLCELADIIRQAQINDLVQRDTFRETFLVEIGNVMNYSLGIGDALFMVVNILGKVLNTSRCLFICIDDSQAGWKCYEFWQRNRVKSCQEFMWPTTDSPIVAQSLLSQKPLVIYEGQENSYLTPVQEELSLIGARSLLAVALRSQQAIHGCVILQQCESRHAWTRSEIDMVQNVADTVAEAVAKQPAEKFSREPIMRLHQRDIKATNGQDGKKGIQAIRTALKNALGPTSIPAAKATSASLPQPTVSSSQEIPSDAKATFQAQPPSFPSEQHTTNKITSEQAAKSLNALLGGLQSPRPDNAMPLSSSITSVPPPPIPLKSGERPATTAKTISSSPWGNLDQIPTPTIGPALSGLSSTLFGKLRTSSTFTQGSSLMSSFHRDKSKLVSSHSSDEDFHAALPAIDEVAAQAKLKEILATSSPVSDYIFASPGLDTRMLGRIDGWVSQVEQKDKYLRGHAMPVAQISVAMASYMGLSQSEIDTVRLAALVHDVGKLGLPDKILQQEEENLSEEELLLMMKHPIDGAELLQSFPELSHLSPIVLSHHEEFDGNGYPAGLSGEDIPLLARIIHIANSYHMMVSPLTYRPAGSSEEAQQALKIGAAKTWDPKLVDVLLACIAQGLVPDSYH